MSVTFEWDEEKAESNLEKHGVSFEEAATAFADTLSVTIPDPAHSEGEIRFLLIGVTTDQRMVVVPTRNGAIIYVSSTRAQRRGGRSGTMSKVQRTDDFEMREEYDFSKGVRGKYAARYAQGSNIVVLDPDIAEVFPDSESVNKALRAIAEIARERAVKAESE